MEPHIDATPVPPLDAVPPPRPRSQPQPPTVHTTSTADRGSFCLAVCSCGWKGPARRSRDLARKDATGHEATQTAETTETT
ncbi:MULTISPECIES: hypothetical protein [Streptomyces]|uniref:Uncharacterized protein n=2 Tax=Streptomyces virginiae TaxID=1961 RepID=A0ABQ3NV62_STRVG|nr:hypothetical protein [Streptomyces virginiae]GGQ28021.1 hypothetical protein GCM10010215_60340 [Streptomyces virginiae]GHI16654.1 hypothetical protein Scinn_61170 [Streptomyces virginiae]GLV95506.1 hypothetical protein Slala04_69590 [Streptomyces lavendulae subsp. lavendulae]